MNLPSGHRLLVTYRLFLPFLLPATESSESSQCMSGSGSSGSDSGCVSSAPQESFCDDVASLLYTPLGSQHSSMLASPLEEKPRFRNSQYISAVSESNQGPHILHTNHCLKKLFCSKVEDVASAGVDI